MKSLAIVGIYMIILILGNYLLYGEDKFPTFVVLFLGFVSGSAMYLSVKFYILADFTSLVVAEPMLVLPTIDVLKFSFASIPIYFSLSYFTVLIRDFGEILLNSQILESLIYGVLISSYISVRIMFDRNYSKSKPAIVFV